MASRRNESSNSECYMESGSGSKEELKRSQSEEGCQVIEESGAVCGENKTLNIIQEFRQIYDNYVRKMECNKEENIALKKLTPFRKLVEDLWEQNAILVETVEELEKEATSKITMLQNQLDECGKKDLENLLKQKDREICCLTKDLSGKNELLGKYYSQIDDMRREMTARSRKYEQILNRLKDAAMQRLSKVSASNLNVELEECDDNAIEILVNTILKEMENQKMRFAKITEDTECHINKICVEKSCILSEKTDLNRKLEDLRSENSRLKKELDSFKKIYCENEELKGSLEHVKEERDHLLEKVNNLHHHIQELDTNFKETRWALTAEVAEKHDQIQELRRSLSFLEEQVRQADMKTLFKDDVIKEMRKELRNSRPPANVHEHIINVPGQVPSLPADNQSWRYEIPVRENKEDLKLDIHIFPLNDNDESQKTLITKFQRKFEKKCSVEVQTDKNKSLYKTRNVSTQHTTRAVKLPRSFGTLTVMPWSKAGGEGPVCSTESKISIDYTKTFTEINNVPCSSLS